jgi:hypothetical protein
VHETACPFCKALLDLRAAAAPRLPAKRLGRAATFAFGASLAAALPVIGCGGENTSEAPAAGAAGTGSGGAGTTGAGGAGGTGQGGPLDSGPDAVDAGMMAIYGAPAPVDAGDAAADANDGGGPVPIYGSPPPS